MLKFYNTLSRQTEEFQPINDNEVRMYICGPTVWNFAHIGNFRTFVFGDVLRRYLKFKGYKLTHVFNLTDIDDRIINEAAKKGVSIDEFTAPYIQAFWEDFDALGMERPEVTPRATHHIAEMIDIIAKLLANGHAYESDGSIYYRISAFPEYGKLSKINFSGNIAGGSERIDTDKYEKEDARDFALWKLVDEGEEPGWDAPFGRGRPGWHIECSAMSMKYLGETFDLHAGGMDLQFPHHENEIAQSEGATGKLFAKYWIHSEFLKIDDVTMSKSKGNFFTFRDLTEHGYSPLAIRYLLLSVPTRKQLNFTFEGLQAAESTVERLRNFRQLITEGGNPNGSEGAGPDIRGIVRTSLEKFESSMDDDFNTAAALAAIHDLVREINTVLAQGKLLSGDRNAVLEAIRKFDSVLGIWGPVIDAVPDEPLIEERDEARRKRDFQRSDQLRDYLADSGIIVEDTKAGARWTKLQAARKAEDRVEVLLKAFSGQVLSGSLFGFDGSVHLPDFSRGNVNREKKLSHKLRADFFAESDTETWVVEVKLSTKSNVLLEQLSLYNDFIQKSSTKTHLWLVVMSPIPAELGSLLSQLGIYFSSLSDFEMLESAVKFD